MRNRAKTLFTQGFGTCRSTFVRPSSFKQHTLFSCSSYTAFDFEGELPSNKKKRKVEEIDIEDIKRWRESFERNQIKNPWIDLSQVSDEVKYYLDISDCKIYSLHKDFHMLVFPGASHRQIEDYCKKLEAANIDVYYDHEKRNSPLGKIFGPLDKVFEKLTKAYNDDVMGCRSNRF